MSKFQLEVTEQDMPKPTGLAARIRKGGDIRPGKEYRDAAALMQVGDHIPDLDKKTAGALARAIEEIHGARTAAMRKQNEGEFELFSVWRVAQRPERKRKARESAA